MGRGVTMKKTRVLLLILVTMLALTSAIWIVAEEQGASSSTNGFITEYPIPTAASAPQSIVVQSSGTPTRVWFTMSDADAIGNLVITDTTNFTFKTFTAGISANSTPYDLVYDAANSLIWFTESTNGSLGRLDIVTGNSTEIDLPSNHAPLHLDMAPDGRLYMTSPATNHVIRYTPSGPSFTLFPYDVTGGNPTDIAVLNNNSIWVTSPATNHVAELRPNTSSSYIKIPVQDFGLAPFAPSGLALDNSGPWITAPSKNWIGRYAEGTLSFWRWYVALSENSGAGALDYTSSGGFNYLWFVEPDVGRVGRMALSSGNNNFVSLIKHGLSGIDSQPTDIVVDSTGTAWITGKGNNVIAQWSSPYANYVNLPIILKP
jgi:virginiamycin B lyase